MPFLENRLRKFNWGWATIGIYQSANPEDSICYVGYCVKPTDGWFGGFRGWEQLGELCLDFCDACLRIQLMAEEVRNEQPYSLYVLNCCKGEWR